MLKDRHVANNGSIHKVCANAVNRPVTIEFLHGGIAHGRDLMLPHGNARSVPKFQ